MYKNNITELIGGTPLLKLGNTNIYAKLEYFNPLHSIKDRAAYFMLKGALERGEIKEGGTVIEPTSGNTGVGLSYIAPQFGIKSIMVMPDNMSQERIAILKILGAQIVLTPASLGMAGAIQKAKDLNDTIPNSFIPNQFENQDNAKAHIETTSKEIVADLGEITPDYLVAVFGSGGTISGVGKALKERYPDIKVIAVEPKESPLLSQGKAGAHKIQGIGANFIPALLNKDIIDEVRTVESDTAIDTALYAARTYGTLVGISSGAALQASMDIANEHPNANIVTIFPDTGERYLSALKID
ncbi:MAG: cysteine synthase A [Clostridia bacterium]|nr:cysteine synthase A [Clostridia bacterium]